MEEQPLFGNGSKVPPRVGDRARHATPQQRVTVQQSVPVQQGVPATPVHAVTQQTAIPALAPAPAPPVARPLVQQPVPQPAQQLVQQPAQPPVQQPAQQTQQVSSGEPQAPSAAPQQEEMPEQKIDEVKDRKETRKRALKGGLIVFPGRTMSTYGCKIRNESSGGVMLVLSDSMLVPPEFFLIRDADPGNKIPCRVAWRGIGRIGVQFVASISGK